MKPMKICGYVLALYMALPLALTAFAIVLNVLATLTYAKKK